MPIKATDTVVTKKSKFKDQDKKDCAVDRERSDVSSNALQWWIVFGMVCLLTVSTRFYNVTEPDHVCWDETHFGKMGGWYINRTFFFDVHPPLGKMLIGLSGYLTGYDAKFAFDKPGDKYEDTNYIGMRLFCTTLGAMIVPFAFLIVWEMTRSLVAASLSASFILSDVGLLTLSQYILLDPILFFFLMGSVLGMVKFHSVQHRSFSLAWCGWLCFTGVMLACCISVKFVGLFVVVLVGLYTASELWDLLGDLNTPVSYVARHVFARVLGLILLPGLVYSVIFYIHLAVLSKSGNGDGFYSSAFQSKLEGNSLYNVSMPREVAYGALITLKNHRTGGGYLHSHHHLYPEGVGARQQQITTYTHKDFNNQFQILKYSEPSAAGDAATGSADVEEPVELVRHGDLIRLVHVSTGRNLHSHKEAAPVTRKQFQVTGYGDRNGGDANDYWKVIILGGREGQILTTVSSKFRLVHQLQQCVLTCSGKQLPKWGYEQQEVSCNPNTRDKNAQWNVEDNVFNKLPNVSFSVYAPGFVERFLESHAVMVQGNAGLKPKEGEVTSRPWQWPINYKGQFFSGSEYRIYLLGNPVIWWSNLVFLAVFICVFIGNSIREQRGYGDLPHVKERKDRMTSACGWLFAGWALHYIPFWAMGRVLYFHHYFPALLFSSMLTGVILNYLLESLPQFFPEKLAASMYHWFLGAVIAGTVYSFYLFAPLAYGMTGPSSAEANSSMHGLKWLDSWEF